VKPYNEYCPVAHALDLVGERWSLLLVRELQHGPLRYSDLHDRLPRCSTNVLASRLKELEAAKVIARRKLPPPAASTVYELTEIGEGLKPVLAALAHWGARTLGAPPDDLETTPGWLEKALRTAVVAFVPEARIGFVVGDEHASLDSGVVVPGLLEDAEATVTATPGGLYSLVVLGDLRAVAVEGDIAAVERLTAAVASSPAFQLVG
jgi:DNA-binding HxlR family transcriptional regulator